MKTSTKVSFLLMAAIPGVWALTNWPMTRSRPPEVAVHPNPIPTQPQTESVTALANVEEGESRTSVSTVDSTEPADPLATTEGDSGPIDFATKYAGKSSYELAGALGSIRAQRVDLQRKISKKRVDDGEYIKVYPSKGQNLDLLSLATADADKTPDRATTSRSFYARGGAGRDYIEVSGIPHGQYPEYDQLQAEEIWLSSTVDALALSSH